MCKKNSNDCPSPLGIGYSSKSEPINKIMIGKDGNNYIVTENKEWLKINDLSDYISNLSVNFYNYGYKPIVHKLTDETGLEQKFGGKKPFFIKGEKWPSVGKYNMTFFGQLYDPRNNKNELYRIFIMLDDDGIQDDYWINKIELNDENLKNQVIIKKPKYEEDIKIESKESMEFPGFEITNWEKFSELKTLNEIRKAFFIPNYKYQYDNTLYNIIHEAYYKSDKVPSSGVKVGGTPMSCQDNDNIQSYDFLQISYAKFLPYGWGDAGIAHVSEDCNLMWDCC